MERTVHSVAREAIEDFNRVSWPGDFKVDERTRAYFVAEPVIVPMRAVLEGTEYRGATALDDFSAANAKTWERLRVDPTQVSELDDGSALIYAEMTAIARETRIQTKAQIVLHMVLDRGRIACLRTFMSEAEALREVAQ